MRPARTDANILHMRLVGPSPMYNNRRVKAEEMGLKKASGEKAARAGAKFLCI